MKHLLTTLCLASLAATANAQETYFSAPGGAVVQMDVEACPQDMICVDAVNADAESNLSYMLPEWVDESALESRFDDLQAAAYVRGVSDSTVVDVCNYCDCCLLVDGIANDGVVTPWEGTSQALQTIPLLEADE